MGVGWVLKNDLEPEWGNRGVVGSMGWLESVGAMEQGGGGGDERWVWAMPE